MANIPHNLDRNEVNRHRKNIYDKLKSNLWSFRYVRALDDNPQDLNYNYALKKAKKYCEEQLELERKALDKFKLKSWDEVNQNPENFKVIKRVKFPLELIEPQKLNEPVDDDITIAFLDFETTGLNHKTDEVIELGLAKPEQPYQAKNIDPATIRKANQVDRWAHMIDSMELTARLRQLAIHATIDEESTEEHLILRLDQATKHLVTNTAQQQLQQNISQFLSRQILVTINEVNSAEKKPQAKLSDSVKSNSIYHTLPDEDVIKKLRQPFTDYKNFPRGFTKSGDFTIAQSKILETYGNSLIALKDGIKLTEIELNGIELKRLTNTLDTQKAWIKYNTLINKTKAGMFLGGGKAMQRSESFGEEPQFDHGEDHEVDNGYKDDEDYS